MVTINSKSRAVLKTSMGDITLQFLPDKAPRTCENFVKLAHRNFYEGLIFHRVLKDFMVQSGCPKGDGTGGPGYSIRPEFNDTPHVKGTVSMARSNDPNSAGSQFFICMGDARYLDSRYAAFAKVVDGEDVLDRIASVPVTEGKYKERALPRDPIYINAVILSGIDDLVELDGGDQPAAPAVTASPDGEMETEPDGKPEESAKVPPKASAKASAKTAGKPAAKPAAKTPEAAEQETAPKPRRRRARRPRTTKEEKEG